jgi:hypothetical protein
MARIASPLRPAQGVTLTPTDPPLPPLHRRSHPLTTGPATFAPSPSSATSVTEKIPVSPVDLAVLTSRIRSFNLTLSEIEGELSQPGPWRVEQLALLIDQVECLFGRRQLSQLYYDALTPQQQLLVEGFTPADPALALLDQRLFEVRVALMDANLGPNPPASQGDLKQLRSLSERIKSWSLPETEANKP